MMKAQHIAFAFMAFLALVSAAHAEQTIEGWQVQSACRARLTGDGINIVMMHRRDDKIGFIVGHRDWKVPETTVEYTLQVDGDAPVAFHADTLAIAPVIATVIEDDALVERVKRATTLTWHLPWGDFQATVTGLSAAYDALQIC